MSDYQAKKLLALFPCKHMGNLLLCLPHIKAMLDANPDNTTLLAAAYRPLVEESIGNDPRIHYFDRRQIAKQNSALTKLRYFWQQIRLLRSCGADYVVDPEAEPVSTNLMRLSGVKRRVGPSFTRRAKHYNIVHQIDKDNSHIFDCYQAVCEDFYPKAPAKVYLPFRVNESVWRSVLKKLSNSDFVVDKPYLILHVAATKDYKQWPAEYFAELLDRLTDAGYQVVTIGAGQLDRDKIERVAAISQNSFIDTCDQLNLKELIALMQHAEAFAGNDSGPMHLASACAIPVLALFGPTSTITWAPISPSSHIVKGSTPCAPECKRSVCLQNYACLSSLSVDTVFDKLLGLIK